ncbi:MAG: MogA/MoaB family molybdenum cofactor biosynthesis protein [Candidatus Sericytochromatia bacterium]
MRIGILTLSDTRTPANDESGKALRALVEALPGGEVVAYHLVADDQRCIESELIRFVDDLQCQVVLTTGGTGLGPRDVTPEATTAVCDRLVPGIAEAMRARSMAETPMAMLSRAVAGMRGACLIVNLPGSPKGAVTCAEVVLPVLGHALWVAAGQPAH